MMPVATVNVYQGAGRLERFCRLCHGN